MIPEFPIFKILELSDKEIIQQITSRYEQHSDFNFSGAYSWDIRNKIQVSLLNDNYVMMTVDYLSGEQFLTYLGTNNVDDTTNKLLIFAKENAIKPELKLISQKTAQMIDRNVFDVIEDLDNFDYIVDLVEISEYNTYKTKSRKRAINSFLKNFSPVIRQINFIKDKELIYDLFSKCKIEGDIEESELDAVSRFMQFYENKCIISTGFFINEELVGFCFSEVINSNVAYFHFWKAYSKISKYLYTYLMQINAKILIDKYGCKKLNIEQDMGIQGLRKWKSSFDKTEYIKKYKVTFKK